MDNWLVKAALSGLIGGYVGAYVSRRVTADWVREEDGPEKRAAIASAIQTVAIAGTFAVLGMRDADPSLAAAPAVGGA
jgi:hypothetical protein